jgi:hypothetical protein
LRATVSKDGNTHRLLPSFETAARQRERPPQDDVFVCLQIAYQLRRA